MQPSTNRLNYRRNYDDFQFRRNPVVTTRLPKKYLAQLPNTALSEPKFVSDNVPAPAEPMSTDNHIETQFAPVPANEFFIPEAEFSRKRIGWPLKIVYAVMVLTVFGIGLTAGLIGIKTNNKVEAQIGSNKTTATGEGLEDNAIPDETLPTNDDLLNYEVAADLPRYISIPKINVSSRVRKMGITQSGAMQAPANIFDAGWFEDSAKPGQKGAMLIDGHVHGPSQPGIFSDLSKLASGDEIEVFLGDNRAVKYTIQKVESVPEDQVDMAKLMVPIDGASPGLNIITCSGKYDPSTNDYPERLLVYAAKITDPSGTDQ